MTTEVALKTKLILELYGAHDPMRTMDMSDCSTVNSEGEYCCSATIATKNSNGQSILLC